MNPTRMRTKEIIAELAKSRDPLVLELIKRHTKMREAMMAGAKRRADAKKMKVAGGS